MVVPGPHRVGVRCHHHIVIVTVITVGTVTTLRIWRQGEHQWAGDLSQRWVLS